MLQADDQWATDLAVCFEVKLYLASLMHKLKPGEILAFISSDPQAEDELSEWVSLRGYDLLMIEQLDDKRTRFLIQRTA